MKFRITVILMYLIALFWIGFSVIWFFRGSDYRYFYGITGILFAAGQAILAYLLNKKLRWVWWASVVLAGITILLTLADQVGWADLIFLTPAVVMFVMLIVVRQEFRMRSGTPDGEKIK